jgi:alpha-L-rhamnosidase
MKHGLQVVYWALLIAVVSGLNSCQTSIKEVGELNVRFIANIDHNPMFSWKISNNYPEFRQSAYRILVADNMEDLKNRKGNIWDSGKLGNESQQHSKNAGKEMANGKPYFAMLQIWDQDDKMVSGEPVRFYMPIDYPKDWQANWITYEYRDDSPLPVFRTNFQVEPNKIEYIRLYISAPGFYEACLNGKKIGENVLDPGQTNYEDYGFYTAYDIDPGWLKNENVLGVMLGNGWYNQNQVWDKKMIYGQPVFISQLVIHYKNGETTLLGSGKNWKWKSGPITYSNIYGGETYNANLETDDWFEQQIVSAQWKDALIADNHPANLYEQFADPIKKMDSINVVRIIDKNDGKYIFDFGQNFSGWAKLSVRGKEGQEITLRHVEVLDSNNNINPITTGFTATKVIQTSKYICKGEGLEVWEPRFAYYGFRFVEVEGLDAKPSEDLLKGIVVYSSVPKTGHFSCSEHNINKLHELADWTIIGNIHGIPTDCPHREKCGWTGDVHAFAQAFMYNYDAQRFLTKYMFDLRSSARKEKPETFYNTSFYDRSIAIRPKGVPTMVVPGKRTGGIASPDWGTVTVQLPWYLYLYYGDTKILREFYPDMKIWVDYIHSFRKDGIIPNGLGDWCPPQGVRSVDCPVPISSTAFHILDVDILSQAAKVLGKTDDYECYASMLGELRMSFNQQFYDQENFTYGSQTADVMALDLGLVPEGDHKKVAQSIIKNINNKFDGFLSTGIFGLARIFKVLSENGLEDEAYGLLTKRGHNSFAHMWEAFDATTLWEVLPVLAYNERSHSHPMQAGYGAWFYSGIAGINPTPDAPGFKEIIFKPYLTRQLKYAEAEHESVYGTIKSSWNSDNGRLKWRISIPANSKGKIYVPNYGKQVDIKLNGKSIKIDDFANDFIFIGEYLSGDYQLEIVSL